MADREQVPGAMRVAFRASTPSARRGAPSESERSHRSRGAALCRLGPVLYARRGRAPCRAGAAADIPFELLAADGWAHEIALTSDGIDDAFWFSRESEPVAAVFLLPGTDPSGWDALRRDLRALPLLRPCRPLVPRCDADVWRADVVRFAALPFADGLELACVADSPVSGVARAVVERIARQRRLALER